MGKDKRKVCGTCKYHDKVDEVWCCMNENSDNYPLETEYLDRCPDYESRYKEEDR